MWDSHNGYDLGSSRLIEQKGLNVLFDLRYCIFCNKEKLTLQFAFTDNYTCIDCLIEIIEKFKLYSFIETQSKSP